MNMPLTADDVLVGILHEIWAKDNSVRITADRERLHRAFESLKADFTSLMDEFSFRRRETFAESAELDQALSNLDAAGILSRYNMTPRYYTVSQGLDVCYTRFVQQTLREAGVAPDVLAAAAEKVRASIGETAA